MSDSPANPVAQEEATSAVSPGPEAEANAIALRARGLVKHYGRLRVVRGLDMEVPRGEIYGFLGRNGAGKTTTIRMLMGILAPTKGQIEFFGQKTKRTTIPLKRRIGYVSQSQHYYPWMNARQLGRFVSSFYPTWDAAEYDRLLNVLELPFNRRTSQLSGGMKMKLALALALAHHPELLILDEPTAGLDPVAQREFLEIVKNQSRNHGRTTLFSTHRIDEVERAADRVGIIDEGVMRYEGDLDILRSEVRRVSRRKVEESPQPASGSPESETAIPPSPAADAATGDTGTEPISSTPPPLSPRDSGASPPLAHQPERFELLRDESSPESRRFIYRSLDSQAWTAASLPGWEIESLSLEDIFLAYAGMKVADV